MHMLDAYWTMYAATLRAVREEKPDTFPKLAEILGRFQQPTSAGDAFFPDGADDVLGDALDDAGWDIYWDAAYLWTAVHPRTRARIRYIEGDLYDQTPNEGGKR